MILTAIIVDDEPLARNLLAAILDDIADLKIVAECKNLSLIHISEPTRPY